MKRRFYQLFMASLVMGSVVFFLAFKELYTGHDVIRMVQATAKRQHKIIDFEKLRQNAGIAARLPVGDDNQKQDDDVAQHIANKPDVRSRGERERKPEEWSENSEMQPGRGDQQEGENDDNARSQDANNVANDVKENVAMPMEEDPRYKNGVFGGGLRVHDYIPKVPVGSAPPRIPHIIHQTWDDENVPVVFSDSIRSWTKLNPDWEYWFWTPKEVNRMLEKYYPEYSNLYGNYSEAIFKANLMRYFIMHKYGGVYADLDLECLRPLDNWTMDNECIMSQNHYVHAYIVGERTEAEVMITFLASRPGHPYYKKAIEMLPSYRDMKYNSKLVYAGMVYEEYRKMPESKLPENRVTVTHPDYFLPTYDKGWLAKVRRTCSTTFKDRTALQQETCEGIWDGTDGRKPKSFSYANHYWEHVIMWGPKKGQAVKTNIRELIPKAITPLSGV